MSGHGDPVDGKVWNEKLGRLWLHYMNQAAQKCSGKMLSAIRGRCDDVTSHLDQQIDTISSESPRATVTL